MALKNIIKKLIPGKYDLQVRFLKKIVTNDLDYELKILRKTRQRCSCIIDIGANIGIHSFYFSKFADSVESFEPLEDTSLPLKNYIELNAIKNITLHNCGLSSKNDLAKIYIPLSKASGEKITGLASINDPGGIRLEANIQIKRLDDFMFKNVDIIKIDVEGHELEVLKGASATIRNSKPILLIEIEQRHLGEIKIIDIFEYIASFGYKGKFYVNEKPFSIKEFSYEDHQKNFNEYVSKKKYVNNFLFFPI